MRGSVSISSNTTNPYCGAQTYYATAVLTDVASLVNIGYVLEDEIDYQWQFSDGVVMSGQAINRIFPNHGVFSVSAFVSYDQVAIAPLSGISAVRSDDSLLGVFLRTRPLSGSVNQHPFDEGDRLFLDTGTTNDFSGNYTLKRKIDNGFYFLETTQSITSVSANFDGISDAADAVARYADSETYRKTVVLSDTVSVSAKPLFDEYVQILTNDSADFYQSTVLKFRVFYKTAFRENLKFNIYLENAGCNHLDDVVDISSEPYWMIRDVNGNIIKSLTATGTKLWYGPTGVAASDYYVEVDGIAQDAHHGGLSGDFYLYVYNELPSNPKLNVVLETAHQPNPYDVLNPTLSSFSNSVLSATFPMSLSALTATQIRITKDGYNPVDSFLWSDLKQPVCLNIYNAPTECYPYGRVLKNHPAINQTVSLTTFPSGMTIHTDPLVLSAYDSTTKTGGALKINFTPNVLSATAYLSANIVGISATNSLSSLSGTSDRFSINAISAYTIIKQNEDYDLGAKMHSYALNERLYGQTRLWNLVKTALGDDSTDIDESVGKTIYERVANYVINNGDIDTEQLISVQSQLTMIGSDDNIEIYRYPQKIKRLFELLSVDTSTLIGTPETEDTNYGHYVFNDIESLVPIDWDSIVFEAGEKYIVRQRNGDVYYVLTMPTLNTDGYDANSYVPSITNNNLTTYNLATYKQYNPHGLVNIANIERFYDFFEYNFTNGVRDSLIDFENAKTIATPSQIADFVDRGSLGAKIMEYHLKKELGF